MLHPYQSSAIIFIRCLFIKFRYNLEKQQQCSRTTATTTTKTKKRLVRTYAEPKLSQFDSSTSKYFVIAVVQRDVFVKNKQLNIVKKTNKSHLKCVDCLVPSLFR